MHRFLAFLFIALCLPASAQAQIRPQGPFRLGMSVEEARAALPSATWELRDMGGGVVALMTRSPVYIGDSAYFPMLMHTDGSLFTLTYGRPLFTADAAACTAEAIRTVLALEGEGAFAGGRTPEEPSSAWTETRTTGGSIVRSYQAAENGAAMTHANRPGEPFAEVVSNFAMRTIQEGSPPVGACLVALQYGDDPAPPPSLPVDVPTTEELNAATLLTGLRFIEMPDGSDFARWYPPEALAASVEGRVTLDCLIGPEGYLRCAIESEEPSGAGFGAAAQQISLRFRAAPDVEGVPTAGARVRRTIVFRVG